CREWVPFLFEQSLHPRALPSFPTRRSSDLSRDPLVWSARLSAERRRRHIVSRRRRRRGHRAGTSAAHLRSVLQGGCGTGGRGERSEEHTSELQSRSDLVCRLLLEKKKANDS